jgi:hypothetical protein
MGTKEKLIDRFVSKPSDFTYTEWTLSLGFYGYSEVQRSGSGVVFTNKLSGLKIKFHKPHPVIILKGYQLELIERELRDLGLI